MKSHLTTSFIFIASFIISISNPGVISINDDETSEMQITSEWKKMSAKNRPPTNDDYLYVTGPNALMNIVYTNPPKAGCETCLIEISLRYWANWNMTKFSVVKEGTELFRLAVMPCHRLKPATQFILFDDFDPSTWNYAVYTASRDNEFNFKCDKKVEIEVSDNEDYVDKITPNDEYMVAIKDLHMKYYCIMKNPTPLLSNETCAGGGVDSVSAYRCVDSTCNKDDCPSSFSIQGGSWSPDNLPNLSDQPEDFWYTNGNLESTRILLKERISTRACVSVQVWITGESNLQIDIGPIKVNLATTGVKSTETGKKEYQWKTLKLCPRWFYRSENEQVDSQSSIYLTSHITEKSDLVAVSINNLGHQSQDQPLNTYLHHFSRPEAKSEWSVLPSFLDTSTGDNNQSTGYTIELTFPGSTNGNGYIFSTWFQYSPGLKFRGLLNASQLNGYFSAHLNLHKSNGEIVFTKTVLTIGPDSPASMRNFHHLDVKLENTQTRSLEKSTPCFVLINVTFNSLETSKLTLSEADVGDGCREREITCMGHGECINLDPDQYQCSCNRGWTGSHCETINYCQTVDQQTGLTGDQFCEQSEGQCNPMIYNPSSHTCDCDKMRYWKLIKSNPKDRSTQIKGNCEPVSKCVGLIDLCPIGYACDDEVWSAEKPCQVCDLESGYTMYEGKCVKIDTCYEKCGTAKCYPIGADFYCYCDDDEELNFSSVYGLSCKPVDQCTAWTSQAMKCSHNCQLVDNVPHCACFNGYTLSTEDGKTCEPWLNCTISCPEGSICALDSTTNSSICTCPAGWDWDESSGKCVDICTLAELGNKNWIKYVYNICGNTKCTLANDSSLRCTCIQPTITNKSGLCEVEKICYPENRGFHECLSRNALCEPRSDGRTFTYRCLCPPDKAFVNGVCVDQCNKKKAECDAMNAICRTIENEVTGDHVATCTCRPGFVMIANYCYLAQHSIKATFSVKITDTKLTQYGASLDGLMESFCSNINFKFVRECHLYTRGVILNWLEKEFGSSMNRIIARYVDSILSPDISSFASNMIDSVTLISYEQSVKPEWRIKSDASHHISLASSVPNRNVNLSMSFFDSNKIARSADYNITVSLQLKSKPIGHSSLLRLLCYDVFSPVDPRYNYCLIPSQTLIHKETIEESDLVPCNENTIIDYCPDHTKCVLDHDETKYSCICEPGYGSQTSMKLDQSLSSLVKHYCVDVDECAQGSAVCPVHSTCVNTMGSYSCDCDDSYIYDSGKCKELCEYQACKHGKCLIISNHSATCRCDAWYTGEKCDRINKVALFWRTTTIIVASSLTSIIVIFILTSIYVVRRSKSAAVENGYLKNRIELTDSMYMRNLRPTMQMGRHANRRNHPISANFDLQT